MELRMNFYTVGRNTKALKNDSDNKTTGKLIIENRELGNTIANAAIKIRARTDLNHYSQPGIFFDCASRYGACLYMTEFGELRFKSDNGKEVTIAKFD